MKKKQHRYILTFDSNKGYLVKPGKAKRKLMHPVVAVGRFRDMKRQSDLMNNQFEIH